MSGDAYYFGSWGRAGHYLHGPGGREMAKEGERDAAEDP